jgi:hypothetical protein
MDVDDGFQVKPQRLAERKPEEGSSASGSGLPAPAAATGPQEKHLTPPLSREDIETYRAQLVTLSDEELNAEMAAFGDRNGLADDMKLIMRAVKSGFKAKIISEGVLDRTGTATQAALGDLLLARVRRLMAQENAAAAESAASASGPSPAANSTVSASGPGPLRPGRTLGERLKSRPEGSSVQEWFTEMNYVVLLNLRPGADQPPMRYECVL